MIERLIEETTDLVDLAEKQRIAQSVPVVRTSSVDELNAGLNRNTVGMGLALNTRQTYTKPPASEIARRRAKGKRQRAARKAHR